MVPAFVAYGGATGARDRGPYLKGESVQASAADQLLLLDLQTLDSTLAQLDHRQTHLPELAALRDADVALSNLAHEVGELDTQRSDVARESHKLELDIEQVRTRATRDQQRLDSGAITSAKELESLQHEVASLARRQSELEDVELDILQRIEDIDVALKDAQARRDALQQHRAEVETRRDEQLQQIAEERATTQADRAALAPRIPAELLALYDKLRDQLGGVAVAALKNRRCDGCRLELNAIELGRFRAAAPEEVLRCEECRRIVVRTPESGL